MIGTIHQQRQRMIPFKRRLKANRTLTERMLAEAFRKRGWWFKEQSAMYDAQHAYIADFVLSTSHGRLIIEVDGPSHKTKCSYDARRDEWMIDTRHCQVLRFTDKEVFHSLASVIHTIGSFYPRKR